MSFSRSNCPSNLTLLLISLEPYPFSTSRLLTTSHGTLFVRLPHITFCRLASLLPSLGLQTLSLRLRNPNAFSHYFFLGESAAGVPSSGSLAHILYSSSSRLSFRRKMASCLYSYVPHLSILTPGPYWRFVALNSIHEVSKLTKPLTLLLALMRLYTKSGKGFRGM